MVPIMLRVKNKDFRTTSTSSVYLFDFEQVNVYWDVIKSLLNDFRSILKMLCIKCCPLPSNFYWHNALTTRFSIRMQVTRLPITYYILEKLNQ